jgi:hypothetical protein
MVQTVDRVRPDAFTRETWQKFDANVPRDIVQNGVI